MKRVFFCEVAATAWLVAACNRPPPAPPIRSTDADLRRQMALLATGREPSPREIDGPLDGFVDRLLADEGFAGQTAAQVLFRDVTGTPSYFFPSEMILEHSSDQAGRKVYHLGRACRLDEARSVHPWWAIESTVSICPDAYQPDRLDDPQSGFDCSGLHVARDSSARSKCGCGPALVRCWEDHAQVKRFRESMSNELGSTVARAVREDLPIATLFTSNETVRDRNAELLYRRWRVEAGAPASILDARDWPEKGKWSPRYEAAPGQHAGVLTTPKLVYHDCGLRARMWTDFEVMWCESVPTAQVSTEAILDLPSENLRAGEGWREIASRPICTSCHARMDYGMQFFLEYPDVRIALRPLEERRPSGLGALYGRDIDDARGEAPMNPHAFAEWAVAQKEFASCMVERVAAHVLGPDVADEDTQALRSAYEEKPTMKSLFRAALHRYASHWSENGRRLETDAAASAGEALPRLIDEHCRECHDGASAVDLTAPSLSSSTLERMLIRVAAEEMPRGRRLAPTARRVLIDALVSARWTTEAQREEARRFFEGGMRALPTLNIDTAVTLVDSRTGAPPRPMARMAEFQLAPDLSQLSPGLAATVALEALRGCKAAGRDDDQCLEDATDPAAVIRGRLP